MSEMSEFLIIAINRSSCGVTSVGPGVWPPPVSFFPLWFNILFFASAWISNHFLFTWATVRTSGDIALIASVIGAQVLFFWGHHHVSGSCFKCYFSCLHLGHKKWNCRHRIFECHSWRHFLQLQTFLTISFWCIKRMSFYRKTGVWFMQIVSMSPEIRIKWMNSSP